MPLYKLEEFHPNYREDFGGDDVKGLEIYTEKGIKIGSVVDVLVDQDSRFRYLVVQTNSDYGNKKILLPIGVSRINYPAQRVSVNELSPQQVERLPDYRDDTIIDDSYEEQVRHVYRSIPSDIAYERGGKYNYQTEPALYQLNEQYHQTFRLYEERLIANKHRIKTGEIAVGKHIETETARLAIPIQKERVVIERVTPTAAGEVLDPQEVRFQEGEVARIEIFEETPEIHKEAFVREEVRVRKVLDQDTVEAQDVIRREELDVDTTGNLELSKADVKMNDSSD